MNTDTRAPAMFISHGAPTFALEPGVAGANLARLGKDLKDVNAVLIVSPHWQTRGLQVQAMAQPETIHDFGGFPSALYEIEYKAKGAPELAARTAELLSRQGMPAVLQNARGFDHGAWVPMLHMFPEADVPVYQVSLPLSLNTQQALQLGRGLKALRDEGILVVGAGSITHNLYDIRSPGSPSERYVDEFTSWIKQTLAEGDLEALVNYRSLAPHAAKAHPTEEHFLPLLVAVGASDEGEAMTLIEGDVTYGVLSMESYAWGLQAWNNAQRVEKLAS